jgi:transketolase
MSKCMEMAITANSPVYLRMGKADLGEVHVCPPRLEWGKPYALCDGDGPFAWIATGSMVRTALRLAEYWPGSAVYSAPCLKPLHSDGVASICRRHRAIITLEEHSVFGGLGAAICEIATTCAPTWICRVGIPDRFSQFCGSYSYLLAEHGLDDKSILSRVDRFLEALPDGGMVRRTQSLDRRAA